MKTYIGGILFTLNFCVNGTCSSHSANKEVASRCMRAPTGQELSNIFQAVMKHRSKMCQVLLHLSCRGPVLTLQHPKIVQQDPKPPEQYNQERRKASEHPEIPDLTTWLLLRPA